MATYVFPYIGERPVADIEAREIIKLLTPIWHDKPETAARVLQRVEATFKSAIVLGQRERASPCLGVSQHLGPHDRQPRHRNSLHYSEVPECLSRLRAESLYTSTALALEFVVLTACCPGEVRYAVWDEIYLHEKRWTIPPARMKTRRTRTHPHIVPLSPRALEVLDVARALGRDSHLIFPGTKNGRPLSENTFVKSIRSIGYQLATAHGFRTSFKTWCAEVARVRDEVSEAALAHVISDRVCLAPLLWANLK